MSDLGNKAKEPEEELTDDATPATSARDDAAAAKAAHDAAHTLSQAFRLTTDLSTRPVEDNSSQAVTEKVEALQPPAVEKSKGVADQTK